jgi:hypothetical protein
MGLQRFHGKRPHPLLCAGSRAASVKVTVSGIPNRQNYFANFILYTHFTNAAGGRIIQRVRARVVSPYCN